MTREERRETFVKWGTFVVSAVALAVACVRDPIIWTLRATIQDQLRAELSKYETISTANAKWENHRDVGDELLHRLDRDLAVIQQVAATANTNEFLLLDLARRLALVETNIQTFTREFQISQKSDSRNLP